MSPVTQSSFSCVLLGQVKPVDHVHHLQSKGMSHGSCTLSKCTVLPGHTPPPPSSYYIKTKRCSVVSLCQLWNQLFRAGVSALPCVKLSSWHSLPCLMAIMVHKTLGIVSCDAQTAGSAGQQLGPGPVLQGMALLLGV